MPAKKNAVTTPLHLLQQLSKSLVVHLEKACTDAQKDAEILLAKLEKQRGKTQEKLIKARAKLDEAGNAGVARRVAEDNYSNKVGPGFGRRKSSQNSHLSKGSGQNSKKGSLKNAAMVNNFFHPSAHQPMPNPVVSSVMKQQGWDR